MNYLVENYYPISARSSIDRADFSSALINLRNECSVITLGLATIEVLQNM